MELSKKAILIVSFGTSHHDTSERNIQAIEDAVSDSFPEWEVRRAFTSGMIRSKLKAQNGTAPDSVEEALQRLSDAGFQTVLCQPTHVINGEEFDSILHVTERFSSAFTLLKTGAPLLTNTEDYTALVDILSQAFAPQQDTVYCLMGHGAEHHPADASYAALDYHFKAAGRDDMFVGTVEGYPDFDTMLRQVRVHGARRCVLTPLMVVAGDHAVNDMASDSEDSWKSMLEQEGMNVECVLKGLGEYPQVREQYVQHVRDLMHISGIS